MGVLRFFSKHITTRIIILMNNILKTAEACLCVLAFVCASCNTGVEDDQIPSHFEPVAWKDSMIFLATDEGPCQVQLWDTETSKLVKRYMFGMKGRYMMIDDMEVDKECFWINLMGKNEHLIRVNAASGEVHKIAINIRPRFFQYIEGSLWVYDPDSPWEGIKFRRLNREGKLEQSLTINRRDIEFIPKKSIFCVNDELLFPIQTNPDAKNVSNCLYIANLSKGGTLTEIPLEKIYPLSLLEKLDSVVFDYISYPPDPNQGALSWYTDAPGYADVFMPSLLNWRWFYKIESYMPLQLSTPIITYHRQESRSNLYINKIGAYLFIGGRLLHYPKDDDTYSGLEIGVYLAEGGEELSFFRLWNSNQITYAKKNGKT